MNDEPRTHEKPEDINQGRRSPLRFLSGGYFPTLNAEKERPAEPVSKIEIMRPNGQWVESELQFDNKKQFFRYAAALGRWIGDPNGNVAAVRIVPFK